MWQLFSDWHAPAPDALSKSYAVDIYHDAAAMGTLSLTEINLD